MYFISQAITRRVAQLITYAREPLVNGVCVNVSHVHVTCVWVGGCVCRRRTWRDMCVCLCSAIDENIYWSNETKRRLGTGLLCDVQRICDWIGIVNTINILLIG